MQSCSSLLAPAKTPPFLLDRNWNSQFSTSLHLPRRSVMSVNNKQPGHNLQLCKSTAGSRNRGSFVLEPLRRRGASPLGRSSGGLQEMCSAQGELSVTVWQERHSDVGIKMSERKKRIKPFMSTSSAVASSLMKSGTSRHQTLLCIFSFRGHF